MTAHKKSSHGGSPRSARLPDIRKAAQFLRSTPNFAV